MTDDARRGEEDGGTSERTPELRALEGHGVLPLHGLETGWTVLGDHPEAVGPEDTVWTGTLRPFSGVLGPWRPTVDDLHPRLSFLSLPWLVREVHTSETTGEPVSVDRPADSTPTESLTPETTTVSRMLRSGADLAATPSSDGDGTTTARADESTAESASRTVGTIREVLSWRPVLDERRTPPARAGERPGRSDGTVSYPASTVQRTFRTAPDAGRGDARGGLRGTGRAEVGDERESDRRAVPTARTGGEAPRANRPTSPTAVPTPGRVGRSTSGFRPVLSTSGTPTVLRRSRPGAPFATGEEFRDDRSGTSGESRPAGPTGREGDLTAGDVSGRPKLILQGGETVSRPGDERSGVTDPGSVRSPSPSVPVADPGSGPGTALVYRRAPVRATGDVRRFEPGTTTPDAGTRWPTDTGDSAPPDAETSGPPNATAGPALANRLYASDDAHDTPTSPFASFADTDAAIDHVYHEIERRLRIERERRGL